MRQQSKTDIETFVKAWVAANVRGIPGLANVTPEVDRLAARLTSDARAQGISGSDIHKALGDIDEYLTDQYQQAAVA